VEKERKHQIIRAAIKRFSKHGIKKTTLDEVARDLRIGKATIYHYFSSKEELYFESIKSEILSLTSDIRLIFENEDMQLNLKFTEFFLLIESIRDKYKLLFAVLVEDLKGTIFEDEKELLNNFISVEREIITGVYKTAKPKSAEEELAELTSFIIKQSLALLFASQITSPVLQGGRNSQTEQFAKAITSFIS